jgi:hypothetical protein
MPSDDDYATELRGDPPPRRRYGRYERQQSGHERPKTEPAHERPQRPVSDFAPEPTQFPHETSMFKDVFDFLIPPRDDKPENIRRWRIAIGASVAVTYVHILLACGLVQWLGFSGFAYANDVKAIKAEKSEQRREALEQNIFDARLRQCTATTEESRQFYARKVQELLGKINRTDGQFRLPLCEEVR